MCCVLVYNKIKFQLFVNFSNFLAFTLKKSTILIAFFPYLAQIIISIRGCVACNDLWPWPIFSRIFGLDLENWVCSVASTVLDGFFPYLVKRITSKGRFVAWDDLWSRPISSRRFDLDFENHVHSVMLSVLDWLFPYLPQTITTIRGCGVCQVYKNTIKLKFFANFSNFLAFTLKKNYNSAYFHCILFLTWDLIWINSVGNHGAVGGNLRMQAF